jgi:hypothetical protein
MCQCTADRMTDNSVKNKSTFFAEVKKSYYLCPEKQQHGD